MAKITRDNPSKVIIVPRPGDVNTTNTSGQTSSPEDVKAEEEKPETVEKEAPKKK